MGNFIFKVLKYSEDIEGKFTWDDSCSKMFDAFYDTCELYESGYHDKALSKYHYLLKKDPTFIPALSDLGWHYVVKGNPLKALKYLEKAFSLSNEKIPDDFNGQISWGYIENRHYLRTLHGLGMANINLFKHAEGLKYFEKILSYNPNDNQGIRYLIGDLYFILRNYPKAEEWYKDNLNNATNRYSYGILLFSLGRIIEAIVQISKAIIEDEYIYKVITQAKIEEKMNHSVAYNIENALDYFRFTLMLWLDKTNVNLLLRIYNSEMFNLYYEQITAQRKKLAAVDGLTINAINNRGICLDRISEITDLLDIEYARKLFSEINGGCVL